jgi:hypothetical protein
MSKHSQRQILAKISPVLPTVHPELTGYFAQVSGGEITAAVEKIYVGGEKFPELLCAPSEVGDITLTKHWDDLERGTLNKLRQFVGVAFYNVTIFYLNCDVSSGKPDRAYANCLLVGMTEPDGDSSSGAPATFALTFSVNKGPADVALDTYSFA